MLTGLLDRSALYGVLAEIEALGLNVLEAPLERTTANSWEDIELLEAVHATGRRKLIMAGEQSSSDPGDSPVCETLVREITGTRRRSLTLMPSSFGALD